MQHSTRRVVEAWCGCAFCLLHPPRIRLSIARALRSLLQLPFRLPLSLAMSLAPAAPSRHFGVKRIMKEYAEFEKDAGSNDYFTAKPCEDNLFESVNFHTRSRCMLACVLSSAMTAS